MSEPLENLYFNWLCAKVIDITEISPSLTFWKLFKILHTTEFVWLVPNDDNRVEDGKDLRREFILQADIPDDPEWREIEECSLLEMFIAFARRADYMVSGDVLASRWFWEFIENLGLKEFDDAHADPIKIESILYNFVWRLYEDNGRGGIFPLRETNFDQRKVELWDQLCDYLMDQGRLP